MSIANDPRWADDPSPSYDDLAAKVGVELRLPEPGDHATDVEADVALYWPIPN